MNENLTQNEIEEDNYHEEYQKIISKIRHLES